MLDSVLNLIFQPKEKLGEFQIYKDKAGEWRFRLVSNNGEIVAVGEGYSTRAAASYAVETVARIADNASRRDDGVVYLD